MNRKFGIELEVVSINRQTALRALRAVGINVQDESYNHSTRSHWKLVSDASVRDGFEVVSPILRGEQGIEEAMTVAAALDDAGATVNRSCGFHVHFDAADLSAGDIKTIVKRYAAHEAEIDAVMPPRRRDPPAPRRATHQPGQGQWPARLSPGQRPDGPCRRPPDAGGKPLDRHQ